MKIKTSMNAVQRQNSGFTLVEVMVSSALIVVVLGFLLTTVSGTQKIINGTTSRVNQFQGARVAFESLTRNLSQATLNTYWDMDFDSNGNPTTYRRQSDLHFYSGPVTDLLSSGTGAASTAAGTYPGHGVFFQAPIGFTAKYANPALPTTRYSALSNALNIVGFYTEWSDGLKYAKAPKFIEEKQDAEQRKRHRFRLMQVLQPMETTMIYNNTNYSKPAGAGSPYLLSTDWIAAATGRKALPPGIDSQFAGQLKDDSRVLVENVLALLILPKLAEKDRPSADDSGLTSAYKYDSRPQVAYDSIWKTNYNLTTALSAEQKRQVHQLPPVLQVVMVAIDEASAQKLEDYCESKLGGDPYDFCRDLFGAASGAGNVKLTEFADDIGETTDSPSDDTLVGRLVNKNNNLATPRLNYRIFSADVQIRGSKWSGSY